jgi:hypothetical protein
MSDKKAKLVKRVVTHPNYYMKVEGKLQKLEVGTEISVTAEHAERHALKLMDPKEARRLVAGKVIKGGDKGADSAEMTAVLVEMQAKVDDAEKATKAAQKEASDVKAELAKLKKAAK